MVRRPARHGPDRVRRPRQAWRSSCRHGHHKRVARGKIRNKANEKYADAARLGDHGRRRTQHRSGSGEQRGFMTPLAARPRQQPQGYGARRHGEHLSSALSGAFMVTDPTRATEGGYLIGHFMMAIDPACSATPPIIRADVASFCDTLRPPGPPIRAKPRSRSRGSRAPHCGAAPSRPTGHPGSERLSIGKARDVRTPFERRSDYWDG